MGSLRLRYPVHGPDRVLVVPGHVTHVFHDADDFIPGRILDLVRPEMLAERVLVFEESPGEGFIDHGYGAGGGPVIDQDDKGEVGISMRIRWMIWWRLWAGRGGAHEWRTADPSLARDDKKERVVVRKGRLLEERACVKGNGTPFPSTTSHLDQQLTT